MKTIMMYVSVLFVSVLTLSNANAGSDKYEPDNLWQLANVILVNDGTSPVAKEWIQTHNFYDDKDEDWVRFYAIEDNHYTIKVLNPGAKCDAAIEFYDRDGRTLITPPGRVDYRRLGEEERAEFKCEKDGIYYARISQCDVDSSGCYAEYGADTEYSLKLYLPIGMADGWLYGNVVPELEDDEISITIDSCVKLVHQICYYYCLLGSENNVMLRATAPGFRPYEKIIEVKDFGDIKEDIILYPIINGNVVHENGTPLCAMVLANGQYMFTPPEDGTYHLEVPPDEYGEITIFAFCDNLAPFKAILRPEQTADFAIVMQPASPDSPKMIVTHDMDTAVSNSGWVRISGTVTHENGEPLCAMILANGQHMFTCAGDGKYDLEVPLDDKGEITLFGFCDGMLPFKEIF